jgi:hypothetical protein
MKTIFGSLNVSTASLMIELTVSIWQAGQHEVFSGFWFEQQKNEPCQIY